MKSFKRYAAPLMAAGIMTGSGAMAAIPVFAQTPPTPSTTREARPHMRQEHFGGLGPLQLEVQAEMLGISSDDLLVRIVQGKNFKEIVKDLGITRDQLHANMETRRQKRLDDLKIRLQALVASGKITQAQADALMEKTSKPPARLLKGHGFHGQRENTRIAPQEI